MTRSNSAARRSWRRGLSLHKKADKVEEREEEKDDDMLAYFGSGLAREPSTVSVLTQAAHAAAIELALRAREERNGSDGDDEDGASSTAAVEGELERDGDFAAISAQLFEEEDAWNAEEMVWIRERDAAIDDEDELGGRRHRRRLSLIRPSRARGTDDDLKTHPDVIPRAAANGSKESFMARGKSKFSAAQSESSIISVKSSEAEDASKVGITQQSSLQLATPPRTERLKIVAVQTSDESGIHLSPATEDMAAPNHRYSHRIVRASSLKKLHEATSSKSVQENELLACDDGGESKSRLFHQKSAPASVLAATAGSVIEYGAKVEGVAELFGGAGACPDGRCNTFKRATLRRSQTEVTRDMLYQNAYDIIASGSKTCTDESVVYRTSSIASLSGRRHRVIVRRPSAVVVLSDSDDDYASDESDEDMSHVKPASHEHSVSTSPAKTTGKGRANDDAEKPPVPAMDYSQLSRSKSNQNRKCTASRSRALKLSRRLSGVYEGHHVRFEKLRQQMGDANSPPTDLLSLMARRVFSSQGVMVGRVNSDGQISMLDQHGSSQRTSSPENHASGESAGVSSGQHSGNLTPKSNVESPITIVSHVALPKIKTRVEH